MFYDILYILFGIKIYLRLLQKTKLLNMKKLLFILPLVFTIFNLNSLSAQWYIRGGVGAGFNASEDAFAHSAWERDSANVIIVQRTIFGGFGQGARFSVAGGYMITPYFGVEMEFYYFQGFKNEYGSNTGPVGKQYNRTGYSYQMRATPSLVVQAPIGKFQPYARFGVLIPFWGRTVVEEQWNYVDQSVRNKQTDVEGKFSVGFESSIGCQYNINDNLGIYVQATYTGLRIRSDKATVVKNESKKADGSVVNNLDGAKVISTQVVFQDELTKESNTFNDRLLTLALPDDFPQDVIIKVDGSTLNFDKPLNLPTQTSSFNTFAFSIGVKYTFNKKK